LLRCVPDWATIAQPEEAEIAMDWMGAKSTNCMTEAKQLNPEPKLEAVHVILKGVRAQKLV
jgi:gamma-glutamyl:cysteine ligase YbdK (ATP-grasp superfamily)